MREHLGISAKRVFPVVYKQTSVKLIPKSILALGRMIPKVERAPRIPTKWVFLVNAYKRFLVKKPFPYNSNSLLEVAYSM